MSPQAVATLDSESTNLCPMCRQIDQLITMRLTVDGESGHRTLCSSICIRCLKIRSTSDVLTLREEIRIKDVMDTQMRARSRMGIKMSQKSERQAAADIGGKTVPGSGSGICKGDARNQRWMVEDKVTRNDFFRLQQRIINKAKTQAAATGREWVIRVTSQHNSPIAICDWTLLAPHLDTYLETTVNRSVDVSFYILMGNPLAAKIIFKDGYVVGACLWDHMRGWINDDLAQDHS